MLLRAGSLRAICSRRQQRSVRSPALPRSSAAYSGPTAKDRELLLKLLALPAAELDAAVAAHAAAGECGEGLLEAGLQRLQAARQSPASAADVPALERVCRLAGAALARSSLPPLVLLLDELLQSLATDGGDEAKLRSRVAAALASGRLQRPELLASAADNVAAAAAVQEQQSMAAVARAVDEGEAAAEAALAAAEQRARAREGCARIAAACRAIAAQQHSN